MSGRILIGLAVVAGAAACSPQDSGRSPRNGETDGTNGATDVGPPACDELNDTECDESEDCALVPAENRALLRDGECEDIDESACVPLRGGGGTNGGLNICVYETGGEVEGAFRWPTTGIPPRWTGGIEDLPPVCECVGFEG